MARAAYGSVTDKSSGGSGDPNILKLGDSTRFRLLEPSVERWRQHGVQSQQDEDQFRSVVCPRGHDGRTDATCPLCAKPSDEKGDQRFPISRRFAVNVWDYDTNSVKVLIGGPQIFEEFDTVAAAGINPMDSDWTVIKTGKQKNTKYNMVRGDATPFTHEVKAGDLHDLDKYGKATEIGKIFETLEEMGWDYDSLAIPQFTLDKAEAFTMPFGKHKGTSLAVLVVEDPEYLEYLHGAKLEQGNTGDSLFVAIHVVLEENGLVAPLDGFDAVSQADLTEAAKNDPVPEPEPEPAPVDPEPAEAAPVADGTVTMKDKDGNVQEIPGVAVGAMIAAGWSVVSDEPEPEPEDEAPALPADDEQVWFKLNVVPAPVEMAYADAKRLMSEGEGQFAGDHAWLNDVVAGQPTEPKKSAEQTDAEVKEEVQAAAATDPTPPGGTEADPYDPALVEEKEKGVFSHPAVEKTYKSKSAMTNALNRLRGKTAGETPAEQTAHEAKLAQARDLISKMPALTDDFNKLLGLFEEVAGKCSVADFTEAELDKLIERLEQEAAVPA